MKLRPLIISNNPFSKTSNNGKTLESIFDNQNFINISQLYFTSYQNPDYSFCDNYFRITDKDVLKNIYKRKYGNKINNLDNIDYSTNKIIFKKKSKLVFFIY
jgi:hypothetical protein